MALEQASAALSQVTTADSIKDHPKVSCWHEVYKRFNAKPRKYPSSVEALAKRALGDGSSVPSINSLVDFYNALSLRHLVPVGGEDLDALSGELELRPARGTELFDVPDDPNASEAVVPEGEVVWADNVGATCRRWNWRQGKRTRLTEATTNAYFIIDSAVPSTREAETALIVQELYRILREEGNASHVAHRLLKVGAEA
nr:phenylalanine--tRNA ligase beta subunit-related protein [Caballeronia sp. GAFFF1]